MSSIKNNASILPLKQQYEIMDKWLGYRLKNVLSEIMKRERIDMWVVAAREYNEDPLYITLIPALERTASRLSMLVFHMDEDNLECLSLCRPNPSLERFYKRAWNPKEETQMEALKRLVQEKNPSSIGLNFSLSTALGDGLTKGLYDEISKALGDEYRGRIVSAEKLCAGWLEKRSALELEAYPEIYAVASNIIDEAFSKKVIEPGNTTTTDVEWWIMQRINDLGLSAWFTPTIDLQRRGVEDKRVFGSVILPGDILHCDVGIQYMGLCTDTQRVAYVLKEGENDVPEGIRRALYNCNRFQDIVAKNFIEGRTGNEILVNSLDQAKGEGMKAMLYTHPIGFHGHGAGPIIGLWDNQGIVPARGEYPLYNDTCYALELNASYNVAGWDNQEVTVFLEETIAFTDDRVRYVGQRQSEFIVI